MKRGITGNYKIATMGSETVRAFIPHPLPPEPQPALDECILVYNDYLVILNEGTKPL